MKKLLVAALAATTLATPALAQNASSRDRDRTVVTANVAYLCEIDAPPEAILANPQISGAGSTLGDVVIDCNDPDGFTFSADSRNGLVAGPQNQPSGQLLATDSANNTSAILYRVVVDGASFFGSPRQPQGLAGATDAGDFIGGRIVPVSLISDGFRGDAFAGTYRDVVIFTVDGN